MPNYVENIKVGTGETWPIRDKEAHDKLAAMINTFYPVGSIYMSVDSRSPEELFGGTWEQIKDTFLLSAGDTYPAGQTGGEATHTLTVGEIPSHTHKYPLQVENNNPGTYSVSGNVNEATVYADTKPEGGGQAHNNMPPYLTVYMWKRIA